MLEPASGCCCDMHAEQDSGPVMLQHWLRHGSSSRGALLPGNVGRAAGLSAQQRSMRVHQPGASSGGASPAFHARTTNQLCSHAMHAAGREPRPSRKLVRAGRQLTLPLWAAGQRRAQLLLGAGQAHHEGVVVHARVRLLGCPQLPHNLQGRQAGMQAGGDAV